jgi:hypothetical protein
MLRTAVLLVMLSGCSFVLVSGPPDNHQQLPAFDCTTSRLGPGLDTVWSILQVLNFATAAASTDDDWNDNFGGDPPFSRSTAMPVYGVLAGLGIAGMYYGFSRTGECRSAKAALANRTRGGGGYGQQPGVGTWPPPQGGGYPPPQGGGYPPPQGGGYPPPQGGGYPPPQGAPAPPPPSTPAPPPPSPTP